MHVGSDALICLPTNLHSQLSHGCLCVQECNADPYSEHEWIWK